MADFQQFLDQPTNREFPIEGVQNKSGSILAEGAGDALQSLGQVFKASVKDTDGSGSKAFQDPRMQKFVQQQSVIREAYDQGKLDDRAKKVEMDKNITSFNTANPDLASSTNTALSNVWGKNPYEQPDELGSLQDRIIKRVQKAQVESIGKAVQDNSPQVVYKPDGSLDPEKTWNNLNVSNARKEAISNRKSVLELSNAERTAQSTQDGIDIFDSVQRDLYSVSTRLQDLTTQSSDAFLKTGDQKYRSNITEWQTKFQQYGAQIKNDAMLNAARSGMSVDDQKALSTQLDATISSQASLGGVMDKELNSQATALENKFKIDAYKISPFLAQAKAVLGPQAIQSIIDMQIQDPSNTAFADKITGLAQQTIDGLAQRGDAQGIDAVQNSMRYLSDINKNIKSYDETQRPIILKSAITAAQNLGNQTSLDPASLNTWFTAYTKFGALADDYPSRDEKIKIGTYYINNTGFATQFERSKEALGPDKALNLSKTSSSALTVSMDSLHERMIGEGLAPDTSKVGELKTAGANALRTFANPILGVGGRALADSLPQGNPALKEPIHFQFSPVSGRVDLVNDKGQPTYASPSQRTDLNMFNQMADTIARVSVDNPAFKGLNQNQIKEIAIRGIIGDVSGESTLTSVAKSNPDVLSAPQDYLMQAVGATTDSNLEKQSQAFLDLIDRKRLQRSQQQINTVNEINNPSNSDPNANPIPSQGASNGGPSSGGTVNTEIGTNDINGSNVNDNGDITMSTDSAKEEGLRLKSYTDTTGHITVGHGFNMDSEGAKNYWAQAGIGKSFADVRTGKEQLTSEEAQKLFQVTHDDAQDKAKTLVNNFDTLDPARQDVLTDLVFQLGVSGAKKFKNTLQLIQDGKYAEAAQALRNSKLAQQAPSRVERNAFMLENGVSRAQAEQQLVDQGRIASSNRVMV